MEQFLNKITNGNSLQILRQLKNNSVDCCITSPPYYGLRSYNTEKQIWGGIKECNHKWTDRSFIRNTSKTSGKKQYSNVGSLGRNVPVEFGFCNKCDAWKGELGMENTPELFISHLIMIFEEIKRILKPTGTLWVNVGDCYAGSGNMRYVPEEWDSISTKNKDKYCKNNPNKETWCIGCKPKDLIGIPWMLAFALRNNGWYLRADIIWNKPNPMPESVRDRTTKAHEYIFLLSKNKKYYYDYKSILEPANYDGRIDTFFKGSKKYSNGFYLPDTKGQTIAKIGHERWKNKLEGTNYGGNGSGFMGHSGNFNKEGKILCNMKDGIPARNKRSVWTVSTKPFSGAHFATFPEELISDCIKAGSPENTGIVLDPFMGSGTVAVVAKKLNRNYIGIELNNQYIKIAEKRLHTEIGIFL